MFIVQGKGVYFFVYDRKLLIQYILLLCYGDLENCEYVFVGALKQTDVFRRVVFSMQNNANFPHPQRDLHMGRLQT